MIVMLTHCTSKVATLAKEIHSRRKSKLLKMNRSTCIEFNVNLLPGYVATVKNIIVLPIYCCFSENIVIQLQSFFSQVHASLPGLLFFCSSEGHNV